GIAKLNPTTGAADPTFNPNANNTVRAIALDSSGNPIVGGDFITIGAQPRIAIAKLNPTTGAADATFNPNADSTVEAIAIDKGRSLYYTPNAGFNGVDTFQYTATDGIASTPTTVSVLVNDSPTLDNSGIPTLNAQNQNDSASTGTLISTIIANLGGTKITDPNASALQGIAITNLDTTNGSWQYTTDGTTWNTFTASVTSARLLASDASTRIRFVPTATYSGTVTNAIAFQAWDQITGTNGSTADVTADLATNGTSSVFSSATETADIAINPVPNITSVSAVTADGNYGIGTSIDISVQFSQTVNVTGTPQLSLAGVTPVANYLSGSGSNTLTFRYTVAAGDSNPDLDYVSTTALSLSSGTIKNAANGDAILILPTPGVVNSLGASKAIAIDGIIPTVTINPIADITTAGATTQTFTVTLNDNTGIDVSSLDSSDILVSWSGGTIPPTFVSVDTNSNGTPRLATYSLTPPGGSWDDTDNGSYAVNLQASQVKDTFGNQVVGSNLGSFTVNIPTPIPTP
ncbi:Ig-like domain-containing protein, partial [Microcoleus sp. Pol17C2]